MQLSFLLAKIIGLIFIIISTSLLINKKNQTLLFDLYKNPKAILITGFFEIFIGIFLIIQHNIWELSFRLIITFIGWILLIRGIGRVFSPKLTINTIKKYQKKPLLMNIMLLFIFIVGVYLVYMGFAQ